MFCFHCIHTACSCEACFQGEMQFHNYQEDALNVHYEGRCVMGILK